MTWWNFNILLLLSMMLDADEVEFEDNPEEYIRRDIEGSGEDSSWTSEVHIDCDIKILFDLSYLH